MPPRKGPILLCLLTAWTFHAGKALPPPRPRPANQPVAMKASKPVPAPTQAEGGLRHGIRF